MIAFRFSSLTGFMHMGGHGIYVWSCAFIALAILTALLVYPVLMARSQLAHIQRLQAMQKMQQARQQQAHSND